MSASISRTAFEAAFLQCGFFIGYISRTDIEHWAEKQIEMVDQPSMDMIELAILRGKHDLDIVSLLSSVGTEIEPRERMKLSIGLIGKMYQSEKYSLESSVRALCSLLNNNVYNPSQEEEREIYYLDDEYDLAVSGIYSSTKKVRNHLLEFTKPYVSLVEDIELAIARS